MISVSSNLILDPVGIEDAEKIFKLVSSNRVYLRSTLNWVDHIHSIDDILKFVNKCQIERQQNKSLILGIRLDKELVGVVGFNEIRDKKSYLGYWIDQHHSGRGVVTQSVRALVKYGFNSLQLDEQFIKCSFDNERSRAVADRSGFIFLETAKEDYKLNGVLIDQMVFHRRNEKIT